MPQHSRQSLDEVSWWNEDSFGVSSFNLWSQFRKGWRGVCAKLTTGCSAVPCWVNGVLAVSLDSKTRWLQSPQLGSGDGTQHSYFLTYLHQYLLFITLALSSLLTFKSGRLTHCERIFSTQSHYLFGGTFQDPLFNNCSFKGFFFNKLEKY